MSKIYGYKGVKYKEMHRAKLKNPQTGEWVRCVIYSPVEVGVAIYVRVEWDFDQKFVRLKGL